MTQSFEEILAEAKRKEQRIKERERYLDKATYVPRFMDKVCWCGRKHVGYTKTCQQCRETTEKEIKIISGW